MERRNGINKRWMMMSFFNEGEQKSRDTADNMYICGKSVWLVVWRVKRSKTPHACALKQTTLLLAISWGN